MLLAAFDVMTVLAATELNRRLLAVYVDSVAANEAWARRAAAYGTASALAAEMNAPGNDVFQSGDVLAERRRYAVARAHLAAHLRGLRAGLDPALARRLQPAHDAADAAAADMAREEERTFALFGTAGADDAAGTMAAMDRAYGRLSAALRDARTEVERIQEELFARQLAAAHRLRNAGTAVGALVIVMVAFALAYARAEAVRMQRDAAERADRLAELLQARDALRQAHDELEARVAERTRELEASRAALQRSHAMEAMGSIVASVAHEVRNPLFALSSTLEALDARFGKPRDLGPYLDILKTEVDRLGSFMRDLLDYARTPVLEMSSVRVADVAAAAVGETAALAAQRGVVVRQQADPHARPVRGDRARLVQVLQNLVQNAVRYGAPGTVVVEGGVAADGTAWWSVADEGPGFPEEDLPHVFEPLFTRGQGGTGMGLAIAERIVELHGGTIRAANRAPRGAVVELRIPGGEG